MDIQFLHDISPYVRRARIMESRTLVGEWTDYDYCFTFIESGQAVFQVGQQRFLLQQGDVILIPPLSSHGIFADNENILRQYILHFDLYYDAERAGYRRQKITWRDFPEKHPIPPREMILVEPIVHHLDQKQQFALETVFLQITEEYRGESPLRDLRLKQLCLQILLVLFDGYALGDTPNIGSDRQANLLVIRAMEYIRQNYDDPRLSNEQIAAAVYISTKHLSYVFRREVGVSVHRYLNYIRILAAQKLARFGTMNLSQIATAVGFSSQQAFCKVLKRTVHATPSSFLLDSCADADNDEVYLKLAIHPKEP